jgi:ABC-type transporter Mla subunit MlaD
VAAIPALQEVAHAARSAEKFFDTLSRELPPTLNAIRNTTLEITELTDDVSEGVKSAGQVVKQFDQSLDTAKKQAENLQISARSVFVGFKAAWTSFARKKKPGEMRKR